MLQLQTFETVTSPFLSFEKIQACDIHRQAARHAAQSLQLVHFDFRRGDLRGVLPLKAESWLDLLYRRNPVTGVTIVQSEGRAEIHTSSGQSLDLGGGARTGDNITTSCPYPGPIFMLSDRYGTRGNRFKRARLSDLQLTPAAEYHRAGSGQSRGQGETPITQTMAALQRDYAARGETIVPMGGRSHGFGGATLANITVGTIPYENSRKFVARFAELFAAEGYPSIIPSVAMNHGETDRGIGTTPTEYLQRRESLLEAYNRDHKPITGQSEDILSCGRSLRRVSVWREMAIFRTSGRRSSISVRATRS